MKMKTFFISTSASVMLLLVVAWGIIWKNTEHARDEFDVVSQMMLPESLALKDALSVGLETLSRVRLLALDTKYHAKYLSRLAEANTRFQKALELPAQSSLFPDLKEEAARIQGARRQKATPALEQFVSRANAGAFRSKSSKGWLSRSTAPGMRLKGRWISSSPNGLSATSKSWLRKTGSYGARSGLRGSPCSCRR